MAETSLSSAGAPSEFASPRLERILACTDFSSTSLLVLEEAAKICLVCKAALTIIHVSEYGPMAATSDEGQEYIDNLYREEKNKLRRALDFVRALGVEAKTLLLEGKAQTILLNEIQSRKIDLAVIGTQGYAGLERLIFGSTAESIYRSAECPVMIVGPSIQHKSDIKSRPIVFATDFKEPAIEAARWAVEFAGLHHAPLHCVHVLPFTGRTSVRHTMVPSVMCNALHALIPSGANDDIKPVYKVLYGEDAASSIREYAQIFNAQAIVLNARRLTPLVSHLPPHTTYSLIMKATCPVVTICGTEPQAS